MRATDLFDDYLDGVMDAEARRAFELRLKEDAVFAAAFAEHSKLLKTLAAAEGRTRIKNKLKDIHSETIGNGKVIAMSREENFARKHARTIAVAASTALFAVLSTVAILSAGGYLFKQQSNQITDLNRVVMELKASSDGIVEGITRNSKKSLYAPANLEGSAFAINNNGCIVTSFHMVKGADSIFVQNAGTERTLAHLIYCDPRLDLAVLKVDDASITGKWQLPFSFRGKSAELGDRVFTLGYPRRDVVYGEGSLSSLSGYSNDTSMYQVSIPVNPGNSGGPLLDENGNIIGLIRGKISGAEGTSFAIKSHEIVRSIETMAADSAKSELMPLMNRKSSLKTFKRNEQIRKINPYVFNVLVYKKD